MVVVVWFSTFQKTGRRIQSYCRVREKERKWEGDKERGRNCTEIYICLFIHVEFHGSAREQTFTLERRRERRAGWITSNAGRNLKLTPGNQATSRARCSPLDRCANTRECGAEERFKNVRCTGPGFGRGRVAVFVRRVYTGLETKLTKQKFIPSCILFRLVRAFCVSMK